MNLNDLTQDNLKGNFWLVSADMGYGHHRAIYPLRELASGGKILNANTSPNALIKEKRLWNKMLKAYEFMSRAGKVPLIGRLITRILDNLLYIPKFYPQKDRSNSTLQVRYLKSSIKKGLCSGILDQITKPSLPLVTSFYASAVAAEVAGHEYVYCIICDTDLSRVWVAEEASASNIIYFTPGTVSSHRLHSYGVPEKNILLTGFPLPLELLGDRSLNILKTNLKQRLINLDPEKVFYGLYKHSLGAFIAESEENEFHTALPKRSLTITYAVGGAGAQKETGRQIAQSLAAEIGNGTVRLNLIAGIRNELKEYFNDVKKEIPGHNENIQIIWAGDIESYFELFNECLQTTDILWTKPSELSFYCALGIPLILTPAIGPQEKCNQRWLSEIGAGVKQQDPEYANQWLFDLLNRGRLAEAAWHGFLKARKFGTFNIIDFLTTGSFISSNDPLKR